MSTFHTRNNPTDRSASDRSRHRKKIEKAIKEGIHNIVSDESIIGQDGKKRIKIPVRGIKEYKFIYGQNENNKRAGSAGEAEPQRGQSIGNAPGQSKGNGSNPSEPGQDPGEEMYEVEITLDELASYLFDDLELPEFQRKHFKNTDSEQIKRHGYRNKGIRPRLDKKETLKKKIRRKKIAERDPSFTEEEEFPFHESDMRYRHVKITPKENTSAVIFFLMDTSGSMTKDKKYIARSFFFLLYQFIRHRYEKTEIVFISHDAQAREVDEDRFFKKMSSGGTMASSALKLTNEIIRKRYHPDSWNIYVFHGSDGDNFHSDNLDLRESCITLKNMCNFFGYAEINPQGKSSYPVLSKTSLFDIYSDMEDSKLRCANLENKKDIWKAFKLFFGGKIAL